MAFVEAVEHQRPHRRGRARATTGAPAVAMGNALNRCLSMPHQCSNCAGSGKCPECNGLGYKLVKDRTAMRNEKRKDHQGNILNEVINVKLPEEEAHCTACGGWGMNKPLFRGAIGTASPVDYRGDLSPDKGRHGDGKCRPCKGTGTVMRPLIQIQPRKLDF